MNDFKTEGNVLGLYIYSGEIKDVDFCCFPTRLHIQQYYIYSTVIIRINRSQHRTGKKMCLLILFIQLLYSRFSKYWKEKEKLVVLLTNIILSPYISGTEAEAILFFIHSKYCKFLPMIPNEIFFTLFFNSTEYNDP